MKNLSHKGIGQTDQLPEHFGTNNKLLKELQEIATYDTAKYFYNLEEQPEFIPIDGPETFASLDVSKQIGRAEAWAHVNVDGFVAEYGVNDGARSMGSRERGRIRC